MLEQIKVTFEITEAFLIMRSSLIFYFIFKSFCFALNMKFWLILGDFEARIKIRKALKDTKEKTGVCKVVRSVLKIPKMSVFFN